MKDTETPLTKYLEDTAYKELEIVSQVDKSISEARKKIVDDGLYLNVAPSVLYMYADVYMTSRNIVDSFRKKITPLK